MIMSKNEIVGFYFKVQDVIMYLKWHGYYYTSYA